MAEDQKRGKPLRHFKIKDVALDSTGKPQSGVVTIDQNPEHALFIVRVSRKKGRYVLQLRDVARMVVQGQIKALVAEARPHRAFRARRGLL